MINTPIFSTDKPDLLCLSHLRWKFVFQRPQHLMSRFANRNRVFFFEEPVHEAVAESSLRASICPRTGVNVMTPVLPHGLSPSDTLQTLKSLLANMIREFAIKDFVAWYYTPMALEFTKGI